MQNNDIMQNLIKKYHICWNQGMQVLVRIYKNRE